MVKKEQSAKYDAGIAIDDVALIDCPLKRPTESDCPVDEWKCENQVLTNITYQIGIQNISFFSVVKIASCCELSNQCCQLLLFSKPFLAQRWQFPFTKVGNTVCEKAMECSQFIDTCLLRTFIEY